jgi:hypothetical protein
MVLKSRMMRQAVYGTMKNAFKILIEKSEGMWPLGSRYGINIEMGLTRNRTGSNGVTVYKIKRIFGFKKGGTSTE